MARLPAGLPRPAAWLAGEGALLAGATIAAEGAVGPVTAYAFGQATLAGLVLNFAAVPLMTLVQAAAIVLLAAAAIHPVLAVVPAAVARWAAAGIVGSASLVDAAPWSSWTLAPPPVWLAAAVVGAWWTLWQVRRSRRLRVLIAAVWLAGVAAIATGRAPESTAVRGGAAGRAVPRTGAAAGRALAARRGARRRSGRRHADPLSGRHGRGSSMRAARSPAAASTSARGSSRRRCGRRACVRSTRCS